jgi:hypothetical protein
MKQTHCDNKLREDFNNHLKKKILLYKKKKEKEKKPLHLFEHQISLSGQ